MKVLSGRSLRVRMLSRTHRLLNASVGQDEIRFVHGPRLRVHPDARGGFDNFAQHDPAMMMEFQSFLKLTRHKRCLFDVGAYHGVFSLVFATRGGATSFAIEPSPGPLPVLRHHRDANPRLDIRIENVALGAETGEMTMALDHYGHALRSHDGTRITVMTMDDFVRVHGSTPDVLKIDVEGMEVDVLSGGAHTLAADRPLLFLEIHPELLAEAGHRVVDVQRMLGEAGYDIRDSSGKPISDLEMACDGQVSRVIGYGLGKGSAPQG